jgi:hypothetical protein
MGRAEATWFRRRGIGVGRRRGEFVFRGEWVFNAEHPRRLASSFIGQATKFRVKKPIVFSAENFVAGEARRLGDYAEFHREIGGCVREWEWGRFEFWQLAGGHVCK